MDDNMKEQASRRKGRAEREIAEQQSRRDKATLIKKKRSLEIMRRDYTALKLRWDTESQFYIEEMLAKENDIIEFEARSTEHDGQTLCAGCGGWYKNINRHKCKKIPEPILEDPEIKDEGE